MARPAGRCGDGPHPRGRTGDRTPRRANHPVRERRLLAASWRWRHHRVHGRRRGQARGCAPLRRPAPARLMARILVVSDDGRTAVEIVAGTDGEGDEWTTATCPVHGGLDGDHSYFEDMVSVAEIH